MGRGAEGAGDRVLWNMEINLQHSLEGCNNAATAAITVAVVTVGTKG